MEEGHKKSGEVEVGMTVEINPRSDRTRKKLVQGVVSEILTRNRNHPHGILVKLTSGDIGRVKNIGYTPAVKDSSKKLQLNNAEIGAQSIADLIANGENHMVEFKSDILWSANFTADDIKAHKPQSKELHEYGKSVSKIIIAKSIAGFLNSDGGALIVGVREDKESGIDDVIGVEKEYPKLQDGSQDGYRRMIIDLIKDYFPSGIFNHLNDYIQIDFETIDSLTVCGIRVNKSDRKVFLRLKNSDHFLIRTDASTRELLGEEIVDYCQKRFG